MAVHDDYDCVTLNKTLQIKCDLQAAKLGASASEPQTASSSGHHSNAGTSAAVSQPNVALPGNVTAA